MRVKALLLAAGRSTRISKVAGSLPKPLLKINGIPVLAYNLQLLAKHKIKKVWINLHYQPSLIRKMIGNGKKWGVSVRYSYECEILGTAGAVGKLADEFSSGDFLVLYGDNFTDCNLTELLHTRQRTDSLATIAVFHQRKNLNSGIAGGRVKLDSSGRIQNFEEGKNLKSPWVNAGVYALHPKIVKYIPKGFSDFGRDVFPMLLRKRLKLSAYKMKEGFCLGIDTPEAYARAQKIAETLTPHLLPLCKGEMERG